MSDNPWSSPGSDAAAPAGADGWRPTEGAAFGIRATARIFDLLLALGLGYAGAAVVALTVGHPAPDEAVILVLDLVGGIVGPGASEAVGGVTIGKWVCGLRVVAVSGDPIDVRQALHRNAMFYADSLFFALPAYLWMRDGVLRQRLGDKHARTVVVHREHLPPTRGPSPERMALGIVAGLGVKLVIDVGALLLG